MCSVVIDKDKSVYAAAIIGIVILVSNRIDVNIANYENINHEMETDFLY